MNFRSFGLAIALLALSHAVIAAVPQVKGTYTGQQTLTTIGCSTSPPPPLDGHTDVDSIVLTISTQTPVTPGQVDSITGTIQTSDNIFYYGSIDTFSGVVLSDGTITVTDSNDEVHTALFSNGTIIVPADSSPGADKEPYLSAGCTIIEDGTILYGGGQPVDPDDPVDPADSAGTEVVAGNTQALQSFVSNTVMPVTTRVQNIVVNLVKPGVASEASRFDMSPVAGGFKLSGQTGRAAGDDFRNLAGWGSITYTDLENDNSEVAYDGDRIAFQFGLDYMPKDNMVAGISLGYEDMDVSTTFNQGNLEGEGFTIVPYLGAVIDDNWSVDALVGFSFVDYDQDRSSGTITGSTDATRFFSAVNLNHTYANRDEWLIISRAGLMYAEENTDGFTESDGTVNPDRRTRLIQGQVGADFTYLAGESFEPYLSATYNYDFISSGTDIVSSGSPVNAFDDSDDVLLGAGFNYYVGESGIASMDVRHRVLRDDFEETIFSASYRASF